MINLNSPMKVNKTSDVKKLLESRDITASAKNVLISINPSKIKELGKDVPIPNRPIAAKIISNKENQKAAVFTYIGTQSLESFVLPESTYKVEGEMDGKLAQSRDNSFIVLDTEDQVIKDISRKHLADILKKEEMERGTIDCFNVDVESSKTGQIETVQALRVIHEDKVMYLAKDENQEYINSNLFSEGFLKSDPVYVKSLTPSADADAEKVKAEGLATENALSTNVSQSAIERRQRRALKSEQTSLEVRGKLNELFNNQLMTAQGSKLVLPDLISLSMEIDEIERITKKKPMLSVLPDATPKENFESLKKQTQLELFKAKNGFYIQAHFDDKSKEYVANLFDNDDALLSTIRINEDTYHEESIQFKIDEQVVTENIEVMQVDNLKSKVIELGKEAEGYLKFEGFYHAIESMRFVDNEESLPPLSWADNLHDINHFNTSYMLNQLSKQPAVLADIKNEIDDFMLEVVADRNFYYDADLSVGM